MPLKHASFLDLATFWDCKRWSFTQIGPIKILYCHGVSLLNSEAAQPDNEIVWNFPKISQNVEQEAANGHSK